MFQQQKSGFFLAGAIAFVALLLILGIYFIRLWIGINYWPILLPVVAVVIAIMYVLRPRSRPGSPNVGKANYQQRGANEQAHEHVSRTQD
jgi:hypothetical protein